MKHTFTLKGAGVSIRFGVTYEGLKPNKGELHKAFLFCFGVTYEGLKQLLDTKKFVELKKRFGVTYEGLKPDRGESRP